jgi:hypothetical protein
MPLAKSKNSTAAVVRLRNCKQLLYLRYLLPPEMLKNLM